jgi:hypothetical protein
MRTDGRHGFGSERTIQTGIGPVPDSACRSANPICSSVYRFRFMALALSKLRWRRKTNSQTGPIFREGITSRNANVETGPKLGLGPGRGASARQIGWVSHAGEVLKDDLVCRWSGDRYEMRDGALIRVERGENTVRWPEGDKG